MSFHTIKKCLIHVDGKKYTKNEIKIGDKLMFIYYSKPKEYSGKVMIDVKKPGKNVKVKEYDGTNFILRFTWKGLWEDEDTGKESEKTLDFKIDFQRSIDGERVYLSLIGKSLDGKYKIKGSPRKTKRKKVNKTKKKSTGRKGPIESATKFKVGTIKKGNDNNMWKIVVNKKGIQRWQISKKIKKQRGGVYEELENLEIIQLIKQGNPGRSGGTVKLYKAVMDGVNVIIKNFSNKALFERESSKFKILNARKYPKGLIQFKKEGVLKGEYVIVMDLYDSVDGWIELQDYLDDIGITREDITLKIVMNLLKYIIPLHDRELVHGDIKLANIMFKPETGEAHLIDWGSVESSKYGFYVGTEGYTKNETISSPSDNKVKDMYALGVVIYLLLFNKLPINLSLLDSNDGISQEMKDIIKNLLGNHTERHSSRELWKLLYGEDYEALDAETVKILREIKERDEAAIKAIEEKGMTPTSIEDVESDEDEDAF
jgi:serine/threonine protein kinase